MRLIIKFLFPNIVDAIREELLYYYVQINFSYLKNNFFIYVCNMQYC